MAPVSEGAQAPDALPVAPENAPDLPRDSAELGREIERVQGELERGIQLAGLKNDPMLPLLRTLSASLGLQWRLHDQAVTYQRTASDRLDLQLAQTILQGEQALEQRRTAIVEKLAPELARLTARSAQVRELVVTAKTALVFGGFAVALGLGVGAAGYGAGWADGHDKGLRASGALAGAVQQAGSNSEGALISMVRANNLGDAWARCQKSAVPDKSGRRACDMPMWADPPVQPSRS